MSLAERERRYIRKWRPAAMQGSTTAMTNVAAAYRLLGNARRTFIWYDKAARLGDGDALVEVAYCLQHGLGTTRDTKSAQRTYRAAIASDAITQYAREEAMYHLAACTLSTRSRAARDVARSLLRRANADGDYPEAGALLDDLDRGGDLRVCVCRRGLQRRLATVCCPLHARRPPRARTDGSKSG